MAYSMAEYGHGMVYRSMLGQKNYLAHLQCWALAGFVFQTIGSVGCGYIFPRKQF